jgi:hypothetical protein
VYLRLKLLCRRGGEAAYLVRRGEGAVLLEAGTAHPTVTAAILQPAKNVDGKCLNADFRALLLYDMFTPTASMLMLFRGCRRFSGDEAFAGSTEEGYDAGTGLSVVVEGKASRATRTISRL